MKISFDQALLHSLLLAGLAWGAAIAPPGLAKQGPETLTPPAPTKVEPGANTCAPPLMAQPWGQTQLFLGLSKPDGTQVTHEEFQGFLDREVTPRFPAGLTLLSGLGQFKNAQGQMIQERSHLLILLYPLDKGDHHLKIEQIRQAYKTAFQQESVLRVDSMACISL